MDFGRRPGGSRQGKTRQALGAPAGRGAAAAGRGAAAAGKGAAAVGRGAAAAGRGAAAAVLTDRSASVVGAPTAPAYGSTSATGNPATMAAAGSPPFASLEAAGFPVWWARSSPMGSSEGVYPPGGFSNFLQSNNSPENFHIVGNTTRTTRILPSTTSIRGTPPDESNAQDKELINVDEDVHEDGRTEKRLNWTKDEDIRLASAWLRNSKDPVDGNDRKADQFWLDVTKEYNTTTESSRKRNRNQHKIRWDRVKKPLGEFHGCWTQTTRVYRSGFSDDQLMDLADKMYATTHGDKDFMLKHIWKVVRHERKWSAYAEQMEKEGHYSGATTKPAKVVNLEDDPNIRPIGNKGGRDVRNGKRKPSKAYSVISEKLDKFIEVSTKARLDRDKMSEKK